MSKSQNESIRPDVADVNAVFATARHLLEDLVETVSFVQGPLAGRLKTPSARDKMYGHFMEFIEEGMSCIPDEVRGSVEQLTKVRNSLIGKPPFLWLATPYFSVIAAIFSVAEYVIRLWEGRVNPLATTSPAADLGKWATSQQAFIDSNVHAIALSLEMERIGMVDWIMSEGRSEVLDELERHQLPEEYKKIIRKLINNGKPMKLELLICEVFTALRMDHGSYRVIPAAMKKAGLLNTVTGGYWPTALGLYLCREHPSAANDRSDATPGQK